MVMQAIKRAYEERGVKIYIVAEHELLGVNKEEALKAVHATHWFTSEQGYMEVRRLAFRALRRSGYPEEVAEEQRPDLYKPYFRREEQRSSAGVQSIWPERLAAERRRSRSSNISIQPQRLDAVFWRSGGANGARAKAIKRTGAIFGNYIFDNRYELMNKAATFPGECWRLAEERVVEPLAPDGGTGRSKRSRRNEFAFEWTRRGSSLGRRGV